MITKLDHRQSLVMLAVAVALAVTTATAATAAEATLYVNKGSSSCSDSGAGSSAQPYCSIAKAASVATAGQTVMVSAGTYGGATVANSGTSSAPIVFRNSGAVTISGGTNGFKIVGKTSITVRGFTVISTTGAGILVSGSSNIKLDRNTVSSAGHQVSGQTASAIMLTNTSGSLVVGNVVHHNSDHGIQVSGGSTGNEIKSNTTYSNARGYARAAEGIFVTGSTGTTVDRNISHDNEDSGIGIWKGANNSLVYDNVVYRNGDHGIDVLQSTGARVVANTVHRNYDSGIELQGGSSASIANNISTDNGINSTRTAGNIRAADSGSAANSTLDYNLVYLSSSGPLIDWAGTKYSSLSSFQQSTGQELHGIEANPKYKNDSSGDFHLQSGSPAIDSANSGVSGQPSSDADGRSRRDDPATSNTGAGPRSYDDRGAYEFQP